MKALLRDFNLQAHSLGVPVGASVLAVLLGLYYSTVVLAGLHFAVLQILALWGIAMVVRLRSIQPMNQNDVWLIVAVTSLFAVAVISYWYNRVWVEDEANLSRYARFILFLPLYIVIRRYVTVVGFWFALLLGMLATGAWGVLEHFGLVLHPEDKFPAVSGAVNSIQFGDLALALAAMTAAGLPVYGRYGRVCWLVALTSVWVGLLVCLLAMTRGAWIAIPSLVLVYFIGCFRAGLVQMKWVLVAVTYVLAVAAFALNMTDIHTRISSATEELDDYKENKVGASVGMRLEMWRASWELFERHPVLGVGPGLYHKELRELKAQGFDVHPDVLGYSHPHSEYFFVLATLGVSGLVALVLFFAIPLWHFVGAAWNLKDERRWLALAGCMLVIGYLHFGLTEALLFQHATFLGFYMLTVAALVTLIGRGSPMLNKGN